MVKGDVAFKKRQSIVTEFDSTINGILICTQQSLSSSVNIPTCNDVILESLQWNIPVWNSSTSVSSVSIPKK